MKKKKLKIEMPYQPEAADAFADEAVKRAKENIKQLKKAVRQNNRRLKLQR